MQIRQLELRQFRCFKKLSLAFDEQMVLITGPNGSGKTSILEALHYLCYLRSFRDSSPRHLIHFGHDAFFLRVCLENDQQGYIDEVQAGFSAGKRLVRLNKRHISSYKELVDHYRVITVTEDALELIKGGPEGRRSFLDQALLLYKPDYIHQLREYRQVLENRNRLLQQGLHSLSSYTLWTQQLWKKSVAIQQERKRLLIDLEKRTNHLIKGYFDEGLSLQLEYQPKRTGAHATLEHFLAADPALLDNERRYGRTLFGVHLDDIIISFQDKKSRIYASRGQQKLILLLLKIAQFQELLACKGQSLILLDDFMTDFDKLRLHAMIDLISQVDGHVIFSSPLQAGMFEQLLKERGAQHISLK